MDLKNFITDVPGFPTPEVVFKDISPLLADPQAFMFCINQLAQTIEWKAEVIVWLDARGFIFWATVAYRLSLPFVMIRKPGKLPGDVETLDYQLEYGKNSLSIQKNSMSDGKKVAIVDDVLATWGTTLAAIKLIEKLWGNVTQISYLMELSFLWAKQKLEQYEVDSLIVY